MTSSLGAGVDPETIGRQLHECVADLYPICRSITGDGVRETLRRLQGVAPITVHEVPSGSAAFDWTVPLEWNVRDAWVKNSSGERVIDFRRSNLHVVSYSVPVRRRMRLAELKRHLFTLPEQPRSIPYRTSYYEKTWGFCLSQRQLEALGDDDYEVCIDSTLEPGSLTYGSAGIGAFSHLSSELFVALAGIQAVHVPYKGTGPALIDLLGGRLDWCMEYFPALQKQIDAGELRALAVTTPQRFPLRPDIPTMAEAGVPGYEASAWVGLMVPASTPKDVVDKLQQTLSQALRDPAVVAKINGMGVVPGGQSPAEFAQFMADERARYRKLVDATGITINPQ